MSNTRLVTLLCTCILFIATTSLYATPVAIGQMNIDSAILTFNDTNGGPIFTQGQYIGTNTNLVAGYIGDPSLVAAFDTPGSNAITTGQAWASTIATYTASSNLGDTNSTAGTITGGPVVSGTVDTATSSIELDLSSLFMNHFDTDFNVGIASAIGTWNPLTGRYDVSWTKLITGPTSGEVMWELSGIATAAVPVPAAVWLFGSGLLGLIGISRRKAGL